jgi:filamentous hemagglutinin
MSLLKHRRRCGTLVLAGLLMAPAATRSGDLLRGNAPANSRTAPGNTATTNITVDQSRARYNDSLSRTSRAIQAVQNLQNAARNAAAIKGVNNLGAGLPIVTDGLGVGGLDYIGKKTGFDGGSDAPVQTISGSRYNVTVKQKLQQAFLQWRTFNIGRATTLTFDQSLGGSEVGKWIAFNEILDPSGSPSQIMGQIKAAGQVYIINQNGIIFGGTTQVNTHTLVASSLPINTNLVSSGLLNNPDNQFLFSALKIDAGTKGTPAFNPPAPPGGAIGDVVVQAGAQLVAPTSAAKVGGRVMLVGPNVRNEGSISTPDGQTILAAGLQVGITAHASSDPSIRGLDVFVGKVSDPSVTTKSAVTGTATNRGVITIPRGNLTMTGKTVEQLGAVSSSTSVSLNGSVRLDASYDAVPNLPEKTNGAFLYKSTGTVRLGPGSVIQIVPEASAEKVVGTQLALPTKITIRGKVVHMGTSASILAPSATVTISAGVWNFFSPNATTLTSTFVRSAGQVYLDRGATIDVAGTTDAVAPLTQNILTLQLRGSEFADSTLNRNNAAVRGVDITLDVRRQGTYNGFGWVGTPLADASGYLGIIERTAQELTTAGGTVTIGAGSSVVMQPGSSIDVSGGWVNYSGGVVKTTRLLYRNHIINIHDATPDKVYDGIYTGTSTFTHRRWGITNNYTVPFMTGEHYEEGYIYGAAGGTIDISAPTMALDGTLRGATINGPRQRDLPAQSSTLNLTFNGEQFHSSGTIIPFSAYKPSVIFQSGINQRPANPFSLDALGNPAELREDRRKLVYLSPDELEEGGFGFIKVNNPEGRVTLAAGESLETPVQGAVELTGANVDIFGTIRSPGGTISLNALNISPNVSATLALLLTGDPLKVTPSPNASRGIVTVGRNAVLDASGLLVDDRLSAPAPLSLPLLLNGGSVNIAGYTVNLAGGSLVDVSGGARIDWLGKRTYGDAGSITLKAGQDLSIPAVLGGRLVMDSTFRGFAGQGSKGGVFNISAPFIQIGGSSSNPNVLVFQPDFFNEGGFASFSFTGIGSRTDNSRTPGVYIAPGTVIQPTPSSHIIVPFGGGRDGLVLKEVLYPEAMRSPVSLSFNAPTLTDTYSLLAPAPILVRGDVVMGQGARIEASALGSVSFKAGTISLFGQVYAPGGSIAVSGATSFPTQSPLTTPLPTVYLGPQAVLSTAGKVVLQPDAYGRRIGSVLAGGTISIGGNIVLEAGSLLDVSGTSGILDIAPAYLGLTTLRDPVTGLLKVPLSSGLTTPQFAYETVGTRIDSSGGLISLAGGELLLSRARLLGNAGGPTATGGTLLVSSGRFYIAGADRPPSDPNLFVTQNGSHIPSSFFTGGVSAVGRVIAGYNGGYFGINSFTQGGFDNLQLGGNVNFQGPVTVNARGSLSVATGGFLYADSNVNLTAPYVSLGTAFTAPFQVGEVVQPFTLNGAVYNFAPTSGTGRITVTADLIDIGNLTLSGIGSTRLVADGGSIRGNGTFSMAGDLYMRSAQIYPTTGSKFTIAAYDPAPGINGTITIVRSGTATLPLSAGGTLSLYASEIDQGGVLLAPFGIINLGWDGTGTAPTNLVVGSTLALPVTKSLVLRDGSITSVSAIDPTTGRAMLIPFGRYNAEDGTWIGPNGQNVTVSGLPQKAINIGAQSIDSQAGSVIDIRGGGDLYAYSWAPGLLGSRDLLGTASRAWNSDTQYATGDLVTFNGQTWSARQANSGRTPATGFFWTPLPQVFAVMPGYSDFYSPFAAFNATADALLNDPGYVSNGLKVGDLVQLGASSGLRAGTYTLLPARYALLPGAFMVAPQSGLPIGSFLKPDGASFVNGYRYNGLNQQRDLRPIFARWEVVPSATLRDRAAYTDYLANTFFTEYAQQNNIKVQRLPQDSGQLVLAAVTAMNLNGNVLARPVGAGRGGIIDITSASNITIGNSSTPQVPGVLVLNASRLSSFGAESLLIGGTRTLGTDTTTVSVRTNRITVSNAGAPLTGAEIILASNSELLLDTTAIIRQTGSLAGPADTLVVNGAGALLRVSADAQASTIRTGVTAPSATVGLRIDTGAVISGNSLTLDSTGLRDYIRDGTQLTGRNITISSGIVRLLLSGAGPVDQGLVLGADVLGQVQQADSLSLLTYSTMDVYGSGVVGSSTLKNLEIHAAGIRRMSGSGTTTFQAQNILLDNSANITVTDAVLNGAPAVALAGTLSFDSQKLTLGDNQVRIARFQNLNLGATRGLFLSGDGGLSMAGNITGSIPFIVSTESASTQSITAGGTLTLNGVPGVTYARSEAALGTSISLSGTTVNVGSDIILPSGVVNIASTSGPLTIGGSIDAGGTAQSIYDLTRYTDGGAVSLSAASGNVTLSAGSSINVAAVSGGGDAGSLSISVPNGNLVLNGTLAGSAGTGGQGGSFSLDTLSLPTLSTIASKVNAAGFNNALAFRVRTGNVTVDGTTTARDFRLSTDAGAINVTGTVDVSGVTGGSIRMAAFQGLTLANGSRLDASADTYDSAGKGGSIVLETRGSGGGVLDLATGSEILLGVTETKSLGDFSGTLHLRAPQIGGGADVAMQDVNSTISGASSIIAEGFSVFDLTGSGQITTTVQSNVMTNGTTFGANAAAIETDLLSSNAGLASVFTVRVGAELINTTGDLTLGTSSGAVTNWDLSTFRFGADPAPGVLTLRAKGDIVLYGALSDGFQSAAYNALLLNPSATLPENAQSWSYRITAGADLNAADVSQVLGTSALTAGKGSLKIGRFVTADAPGGSGQTASTSAALADNYQVIRTGSGDIDIATGRDVQLLNRFATIYTAGTKVSDPTLGGTFDVPNPVLSAVSTVLGNAQQSPAYAPQYSLGGGNITLNARGNIGHYRKDTSVIEEVLIADSSLQMPTNWLYRRGYVDPVTGDFGTASVGTDVASTTWWVDFSNFFQGIGALGGGNINMTAGGRVENVDAVIPTNARQPKTSRDAADLVELGGGDLVVQAGGDIDAGVFYVERGLGTLKAGGAITTNQTRRSNPSTSTSESLLPTTLFVGKGAFQVEARKDVLLGPVSNPFMLPGGINNSFWYKSYFSTFGPDAGVEATSIGGDITFRQSVVALAGSTVTPVLQEWYRNILQYSSTGTAPSVNQPWLRLNESDVTAFSGVMNIGPGSLRFTALDGDINLVGNYNLFPSATGNLSLEAAGAVNALQSLGTSNIFGFSTPQTVWTSAQFNLSDASPSLIPGIVTPVAYRAFTSTAQDRTTASLNFLSSLTVPFAESGSLTSSVSTQLALHDSSILHRGDTNPVHIYAEGGDISGLTLFAPKAARIVASRDISDIAFYLQNVDESDLTIVSAGRDLLAYNPNSVLRSLANRDNNLLATAQPTALAGDIQLGGPGTLEVLAGHDIRLGNGPSFADGTGAGILTIGNARNPALPFDGASLVAAAGIGQAFSLDDSKLDFDAFIDKFIKGTDGERYLSALAASSDLNVPSVAAFELLSDEEQKRVALQVFFIVLREAGRDHNLAGSPGFGTYTAGIDAIASLFPGSYSGDIETNSRDIRTKNGGDISLLIPGGNLTLQTQQSGSRQVPPGIVTESGGNIHIFTNSGVDIGISRIFTLRGGSQVIWASTGDIAAGSSSKTVQSAPPTRVIIDPTSADVATDLAGLATGGGIGVLATVAGVAPGSVDLIAVTGAIDAGDAGIRATGNLNIAAVQVLNANNIAVGGSTSGAPAAPAVSVPNVSVATSGSAAAGAATQSATQQNNARQEAPPPAADDTPSIITVEVIGYGGGEGEEDDEEERRRKQRELDEKKETGAQ